VLLTVDSDNGVRKSTAKLTASTGSLLGLPSFWFPGFLFVLLAMVLKELFEGVTTTIETEVSPLDFPGEDSLALLRFRAASGRLTGFST